MPTLPTLPVLWCRKGKGSLSSPQSAFPAGSSLTPANALRSRAGAPAAKANASRSRDTGLSEKRLSVAGIMGEPGQSQTRESHGRIRHPQTLHEGCRTGR
jgi:hypothetical protein